MNECFRVFLDSICSKTNQYCFDLDIYLEGPVKIQRVILLSSDSFKLMVHFLFPFLLVFELLLVMRCLLDLKGYLHWLQWQDIQSLQELKDLSIQGSMNFQLTMMSYLATLVQFSLLLVSQDLPYFPQSFLLQSFHNLSFALLWTASNNQRCNHQLPHSRQDKVHSKRMGYSSNL